MRVNDILHHYPEISGIHPAADMFPYCSQEEMDGLIDSIASRGLLDPIALTKDGAILDGRNRLWACYEARQEPRFMEITHDPWVYVWDKNEHRRHLTTGQRAAIGAKILPHLTTEAKVRQKTMNNQSPSASANISLSEKGQARDKAAEIVGVGKNSIQKAKTIKETNEDLFEDVRAGEVTLEAAYKEVKKEKAAKEKTLPAERPVKIGQDKVGVITVAGAVRQISKPKRVTFNESNENIDWARWTWNPVTGCDHGCNFCYAREIAHMEKMAPYYPWKFKPAFHEYRLDAPKNTRFPSSEDPRHHRVFVCSMADLFGKWVPDEWIEAIFKACEESPQWEYLFLTKWPKRYGMLKSLTSAWFGASVISQKDVMRVERDMSSLLVGRECKRWVSLEPMLEPIIFGDISWCDLMVIGAQTATQQPSGHIKAFSPEFDWIVDVVNQCREQNVPYYLKHNLHCVPGINLPKSMPR